MGCAYGRGMTEQQPYDVVEAFPGFELRRYPEHVVAEVSVSGSFEGAGSQAFRSLFGYITGQNASSRTIEMTAPVVQEPVATRGDPEKIAMTAPVTQTESGEGVHVIAFVLPAGMTAETAPSPTNPRVRVRAVPERLAAAVRFSGRWTESGYRRHLVELGSALTAAGLVATGPPRFARFDPPYKPWFLRRNEVVQDVTRPGAD